MPRLTITLSDEHHRALEEAAVRQNKSLGQIIQESLDFSGVKRTASAAALVARARATAQLDEEGALALGVQETRMAHER